MYADEFLVHAVDVEGKKCGIDGELLQILGRHEAVPVSYAGGIRSFEDIETVRVLGRNKVDFTVGSALDIFGGDLKFEDLNSKQKKEEL